MATKRAGRPAAKKTSAAKVTRAAKAKPAKARPAAKAKPAAKARPAKAKPAAPPPPAARPAPPPPAPAPPDPTAQLAELWQRLEAIATERGAPLTLGPGVSEKELALAEKLMKLRFPPGLRASLRLHDGQDAFAAKDARPFPWLPGAPPLAPLAQIVERWGALQGLAARRKPKDELTAAERIKAGVHRPGRIPIAGNARWSGDALYLDLDPGPAGVAGQLIASIGDALVVVDTSLEAALARWLFVLDRGVWTYDRERGVPHPTGRAEVTAAPIGLFAKR